MARLIACIQALSSSMKSTSVSYKMARHASMVITKKRPPQGMGRKEEGGLYNYFGNAIDTTKNYSTAQ